MRPKPTQTKREQPFYHRKLARSGGSRYLAVSKLLPEDWIIVKIRVAKQSDERYLLEVTKLA